MSFVGGGAHGTRLAFLISFPSRVSPSSACLSPVQRARYVVLDEHVRPLDQFPDDRPAIRLLKVHAHAPLVPVQRHEVQAQTVLAAPAVATDVHERRPVPAAVVAGHRSLDFDHVRAHVSQHHRAVRTRGHPAHVHHPDAVQRSRTEAATAAGRRRSAGRHRRENRSAKHNNIWDGSDGSNDLDDLRSIIIIVVVVVAL